MHHFFVKDEQIQDKEIRICGEDGKHLRKVLRVKEGERILVNDEQGFEYTCEISGFTETEVIASIRWKEAADRELPIELTLFQGLPKGDKMELIIQKAVELGVAQIVPVETKRCVVKLDEKKAEKKQSRWQAIAESAAKQSKRAVIPKVCPVCSMKEALREAENMDMLLIPYELAEGMEETRKRLQEVKEKRSVGIFIGPEGGFEEEEVSLAGEAGAYPITLGKRILRTETAGLYLLSVLGFLLET